MLKRIFSYLNKKRLKRLHAKELKEIQIPRDLFYCGTPYIDFSNSQKRKQRKKSR